MKILQTVCVGKTELKNRLVMPPMATSKSGNDGKVTEELCDYYCQRAAGGYIGLIITEHSYICKQGKAGEGQLSLAEDSCIDGLKKLTSVVHADGTKVFAQLNHAGSATSEEITGMQLVSASEVINPGKKAGLPDVVPHELNRLEIAVIQDLFVQAALRAKKAGFDGVEIHSAHGYLLNQFYSPLTNKRTDEYGCSSIEDRTRFHVEVIRKVKLAVGKEYPVSVRFGGCDYMENGSTVEDAVEACKLLEAAGADMISITGGMCRYVRKGHLEAGYFGDLSEQVKKAVSVPVLLTGGVKKIDQAEQLLLEEKADMIGIGRAQFKNAKWAQEEIRKNVKFD